MKKVPHVQKFCYDHDSYISCRFHYKVTFLKLSSDLTRTHKSKGLKTAENDQK